MMLQGLVLCALLAAVPALATPAGYVLTPSGPRPPECVHALPEGASVYEPEGAPFFHFRLPSGELTAPIRRCRAAGAAAMAEGDGWQAYVKQQMGDNATHTYIDGFNATWTVPPVPQEQAQTLFSFSGLQNIDWVPPQPQPTAFFDIIQPVLQYGYSAAGGFEGAWSIASWYVTLTGNTVYSPLKKVPEGGHIYGIMVRTAGESDSWFISTQHVEGNVTSAITVERNVLVSQPWAYVTMEVYDVDDCAQFPPAGSVSSFTGMTVSVGGKPFTPAWEVGADGQKPPVCGADVKVNSPSAVDLIY